MRRHGRALCARPSDTVTPEASGSGRGAIVGGLAPDTREAGSHAVLYVSQQSQSCSDLLIPQRRGRGKAAGAAIRWR